MSENQCAHLTSLFYGLFREKPDKAEVMLSELLKISPNHTNANITLSRLLVEKLKSASVNNAPIEQRFVEKVIQMYETVITSSNKEVSDNSNFTKLLSIVNRASRLCKNI